MRGGFLGGEGGLQRLGLVLGGLDAALTGSPRSLQTSLLMNEAFRDIKEREAQQRQQQVADASVRSMMNTANVVGTPQTRAFEVNGRTVGQNAAATPLVSQASNMRNLQRGAGQAFNAAYLQSMISQAFAPAQQRVVQEGAIVIDDAGNVVARNPRAQETPFKTGATREIKRGGNVITEEYDGSQWKRIATSPAWKPDSQQPKDTFTEEAKLRSEFDTKTKDFVTVRDAYSAISQFAQNPSAAGDISLVYQFMKVQDPNSTVREGEYATAENAGGVPERFRNLFNKLQDGQFLTPSQRADFVAQSGRLYEDRLKSYRREEARYRDLATQYSYDPNRITYDRSGGLSVYKMPPPQVGQVMDGYRFIGGDPANPNSWAKQ